jgi:hypothetical protein
MEKVARKVVDGKKEEQKFRLRWRDPVLEARKRTANIEVSPEKTETEVAEVVDNTVKV